MPARRHTTELDTLLSSRFEVTRLYKKLVCQMGETNFNELRQTSIIKKLTGGDLIGFEFKNKNPFQDRNYAKIIIATNNLPATSDKTDGFYRRWLTVDFPNKFEESVDILSQIPDQEYENLAFKCIHILQTLLDTRRFTNEGTYEERAKRYEEKSNPFDKFWAECVEETTSDKWITKNEFQRRIESWCKERKYRILSDISISQGMRQKGVIDDRKHLKWYENSMAKDVLARVWLGIRWKTTSTGNKGSDGGD